MSKIKAKELIIWMAFLMGYEHPDIEYDGEVVIDTSLLPELMEMRIDESENVCEIYYKEKRIHSNDCISGKGYDIVSNIQYPISNIINQNSLMYRPWK